MSSGFTVNGVDLDSIFAPQQSGFSQAPATNFTVGGVDLNQRYAPLSTGSAAPATGFYFGGQHGKDLNTIFAAYGTTGVQIILQPTSVSGSAAAGTPSGTVTSNATATKGSGGTGNYSYSWTVTGEATATAPYSATTAVQATVNAGATIAGSMYCTVSDGVTSKNTVTVTWTLTNTSPDNVFTMTVGVADNGAGYVQGSLGSLNPTTTSDGHTITDITGTTPQATTHALQLQISGFSSDPGQGYLTSITFGTNDTYQGSAASYSYAGGNAGWTWSSGGPTWTAGEQVTVTLVIS